MARGVKGGPNRSAFIREKLSENKNVSYKEIAEAWKKLGHSEEIKATLFYLVKNKAKGGKGKRRGRPAKAETEAAAAAATTTVDQSWLEMEKALDKLVAQAVSLRDSKLADDLRVARRRVSSQLV